MHPCGGGVPPGDRSRYRPAAEQLQVVGDWYDAFVNAEGAMCLVVDDVTGHDRDAAAVMGQVRNLLRGLAHTPCGTRRDWS